MSKSTRNTGKRWTREDITLLKELVKVNKTTNTPTGIIALKLKRTEDAVRAKAGSLKVSLKPTNRSPRKPGKKK